MSPVVTVPEIRVLSRTTGGAPLIGRGGGGGQKEEMRREVAGRGQRSRSGLCLVTSGGRQAAASGLRLSC